MKAKARNYRLEAHLYDSQKGTSYREREIENGGIIIYYDEEMYVLKESSFIEDLNSIVELSLGKPIILETLLSIEQKINDLLLNTRNKGELQLSQELIYFNKDKFFVLQKEILFHMY